MSTFNDLANKVIVAVAGSSEIATFCQENFEKNISIHFGVNPEDAPSSLHYPLFAIFGVKRLNRGITTQKEEYVLEASVIIEKEGSTPSTIGDIEILSYPGFQLAEELRELIERAILSAKIGGGFTSQLFGETILESFYPFYEATINIQLSRTIQRHFGSTVST